MPFLRTRRGKLILLLVIIVFAVLVIQYQVLPLNVVSDRELTVTFVWFYDDTGNIAPGDWKSVVTADMLSTSEMYMQCPNLYNPNEQYYSVQDFTHRYMSILDYDVKFYDTSVLIEDWHGKTGEDRGQWALKIWHSQSPVEAEMVWDDTDVVFGIVDSDLVRRGGSGDNNGWSWLSAYETFRVYDYKIAPQARIWQTFGIAHELIHNFGAPDHYEPFHEGHDDPLASSDCIYGGIQELSDTSILCGYCRSRMHWGSLNRPVADEAFWSIDETYPTGLITDTDETPGFGLFLFAFSLIVCTWLFKRRQ